jgi:hypothetical protein
MHDAFGEPLAEAAIGGGDGQAAAAAGAGTPS